MSKDILRNSDIDKEAVFYEFSALKLGQLQRKIIQSYSRSRRKSQIKRRDNIAEFKFQDRSDYAVKQLQEHFSSDEWTSPSVHQLT